VMSGLSSGEGLIEPIRDARYRRENVAKRGEASHMKQVVDDEGVADKRLLVQEGEFAGALQAMQRDGNKLSTVIRDAWDQEKLGNLTKRDKTTASNPHISIVANITREEL